MVRINKFMSKTIQLLLHWFLHKKEEILGKMALGT
jgi:hypothetical protein